VNQLESFLNSGADDLIQISATVVIVGSISFAAEPRIALFSFVPIPFVLLGSFVFQSRIVPRYRAVREAVGGLSSQLANNLAGIVIIKSFTAESEEVQRLRETSETYREANRLAIRFSSAFSPLIRMVIVAGFMATLLMGGWLTLAGTLEVGVYSVLVFLTQRLLWPLTRLGATYDLYQRAMASTHRILDLIDRPSEVRDGPAVLDPGRVEGHIRFENVEFAYSERDKLFTGLNMDIPAGKTTAIVGATGSGKSTLVKLLLRFHQVREARLPWTDGLSNPWGCKACAGPSLW